MFTNPGSTQPEQAAMTQPSVSVSGPVAEAMRIEGVEGAGIGQDDDGGEILLVYLRDASVASRVPASLGGKKIKTQITGRIEAQPR